MTEKVETENISLDEKLDVYGKNLPVTRSHREWVPFAAAATAGLTMSVDADASIVYSGLTNIMITVSGPLPGTQPFESTVNTVPLPVDIDASLGADLQLNVRVSNRYISFGPLRTRQASAFINNANVIRMGTANVANLLSGANIGATQTFDADGNFRTTTFNSATGATASMSGGNWMNGMSALAGFSFDRGGNTHYGWIRVLVDVQHSPVPSATLTLVDFAWEDVADTAIMAGDTGMMIPEADS
ncbi:MAG: hypothetical protein AAF492_10300, partial [Verrucomicrobiota bacterium]